MAELDEKDEQTFLKHLFTCIRAGEVAKVGTHTHTHVMYVPYRGLFSYGPFFVFFVFIAKNLKLWNNRFYVTELYQYLVY